MSQVAEQRHEMGLADGAGEEQRRWPRSECARELVIYPVRDGAIGPATLTCSGDFSTMGLGLLHPSALPKGEQFLVPLKTRSGPPLPLLYSVVYCRPTGNAQFQIGAELVSILNLDEFTHAGQTLTQLLADGMALLRHPPTP